METLKAFIKSIEAPQRGVKIKTKLNFFTLSGKGLRVIKSFKKVKYKDRIIKGVFFFKKIIWFQQ